MAYESLWMQSVLGRSAIQAGLIFLPCALAAFVTSAVVGKVMHRAHPRIFIGIGLLVIAAGALAQAVIRTGSGWAVVIPGLVLVGIGAGLAMAPLSATAMSAVPWQQAGMAGGALSAFRQLGYAFGIAVLGEIFRGGLTRVAGTALAGPLGGGQAGAVIAGSPHLTTLVHQAFADGLDIDVPGGGRVRRARRDRGVRPGQARRPAARPPRRRRRRPRRRRLRSAPSRGRRSEDNRKSVLSNGPCATLPPSTASRRELGRAGRTGSVYGAKPAQPGA